MWQNQLVGGNWVGWISLGGQVTLCADGGGAAGHDHGRPARPRDRQHAASAGVQRRLVGLGLASAGNFGAAPGGARVPHRPVRLLARDGKGALNWIKLDGNGPAVDRPRRGDQGRADRGRRTPGRLDVYVRALDDTLHYRPLETAAVGAGGPRALSSSPAAVSRRTRPRVVFAVAGGQLQY